MHKGSTESHLFQETCLLEMLLEQKRQRHMLGVIMTKVAELTQILGEVKTNLDEASQELTAKIDSLSAELEATQNLSPEAEELLNSIRGTSQALAAIVPNPEPAPEPAPEPVIDPETGLPVEPAAENTDQATM